MKLRTIFEPININKQCKKYGLSLWQCPQFLFLILGVVVISSSFAIYFISLKYTNEPEIVVLIVLAVAGLLMIISYTITRSFERLAEIARMKSEFISIISHQLRAPLANLKWTIDLLMSGKTEQVSEKQITYLEMLKENSDRMEGLISDLLIVSRLEGDNLSFKPQKGSLVELVKKIVSRFEPFATASNVEIKLVVEDNLPETIFDPLQIEQVVNNLLDNAIRYTKGKGLVGINLNKKAGWLYFEIKDNSIGIALEDQKYLFQKFFRGEEAFKLQSQGSGLGLYIAKAIIKKSGGKIGFSSAENRGSVFWFALPIK